MLNQGAKKGDFVTLPTSNRAATVRERNENHFFSTLFQPDPTTAV
jgi:hypothetical protein